MDTDPPKIFVTTLMPEMIEVLKNALIEQGFELAHPPYTHFSAKKKGISCTLYTSLKLTVQGKDMGPFIEFFLEPEILKEFSYTHKTAPASVDLTPHIGVDEAGKGDFFGPLVIAGVFGDEAIINKLIKMGVKDSKALSEAQILKLNSQIKKEIPHSVVRIGPKKYNELYAKFGNLNHLLAWGHATAIENLAVKQNCSLAIIDQFGHESLVTRAIQRKNLNVTLIHRHRAESDPIVAAASILARAGFLEGLEALGQELGITLPRGASKKVIETGKLIVSRFGTEALDTVSKSHFRSRLEIVGG